MKKILFQDKKKEVDFFNQIDDPYDCVSNNTYIKVAEKCAVFLKSYDSLILEVGCGSGLFGKRLSEMGYNVIGIDISSKMIEYANQKKVQNYSVKEGDAEDKSLFPKETFSLILCPGILHHIPDLKASSIISNFYFWLKPGGYVVCWEPNGSNWIINVSKLLFKIYSLFVRKSIYATTNETNHSFHQYYKVFSLNKFSLVSKESWLGRSTSRFKNRIVSFLDYVRWKLIVMFDFFFHSLQSGTMLFLIFRKND